VVLQILDGAIGTELASSGLDLEAPEWSARAICEAPQLLTELHVRYAEAGATLHTANTFRTQPRAFGDDWLARLRDAVRIARDAVGPGGTVLGSMAPVEDCYRPELSPGRGARPEHRQVATALAVAGCDILLCETFANGEEALVAAEEAIRTGLPVWLSLTAGPFGELLSAAELAVSLPRDVGAAIGGILARFGTGEAGGARLGQDIVSGLLAEIPIIGGFLSEILGILLDLPGFVDGLVSFVAEAPGRILSGVATVIADLPGKLIGEFLPALISGVIEGLAMLLVSPIALIEGLIAGIGRLPVALAEALVGLPVRILSFLDPDKNGLFRGSQGRILGIPGTEKKRDRTPVSAGRSADFDPNYTSKIGTGGTSEAAAFSSGGQTVLVGAWAEAVDSLGVAMRTRQAFGGGNVGP